MNYCRYCGMKLESGYRICPSCGNNVDIVVQNAVYPNYQVKPKEKSNTGKDITSILLNILGFYFAFFITVNMEMVIEECLKEFGVVDPAFVIGALLWQIVFGGVAFILSIFSRKNKRTTFNAINLILSSINIGLILIDFALLITYPV